LHFLLYHESAGRVGGRPGAAGDEGGGGGAEDQEEW